LKQPHSSLARVIATCLLSTLVVVVGGATTMSAQARCQDPYVSYNVRLIRGIHRPFPDLPRFKDGPGGTISGSVSRTDSLAATFGVATSAEADGIFAKAKVEINASVTRSVSATIGHHYTHKIRRGHYGHLAYGSWAKLVGWRKVQHTWDCKTNVLKRGKARLPTRSVGWHYWATKK
jgi:hypothetical protein